MQAELWEIFEAQYELTLTEEVEIRTYTDDDGDEHEYEYYILNVKLTNRTLSTVIFPRMDEQQKEIYAIMQELKGNKPYLWEGIYTGGGDPGPTYEIPGEALSDPSFAALMAEATKYIGWPYVWGGSSPSTSFDCSGFVCWGLYRKRRPQPAPYHGAGHLQPVRHHSVLRGKAGGHYLFHGNL